MHRFSVSLVLVGLSAFCFGQLDTKPLIEDVGVDEHLGETIDLDLTFWDEEGKEVTLRELTAGEVPVVIAPVYYTCPSLCSLVLNGVRDLLKETTLTPGEHFKVVNVCIDPENTPEIAAEKKNNYLNTLPEPEAVRDHWTFLTGQKENIEKATDQLGFRYKWVNDQYSHASVIMLVSPEGKITRYIYGIKYNPRDFRLAVVEASQGKVGNTVDRILMYCFRYDPLAGKYVPVAQRIMKLGAFLSLLMLVAFMSFLWVKEFHKKRRLHV